MSDTSDPKFVRSATIIVAILLAVILAVLGWTTWNSRRESLPEKVISGVLDAVERTADVKREVSEGEREIAALRAAADAHRARADAAESRLRSALDDVADARAALDQADDQVKTAEPAAVAAVAKSDADPGDLAACRDAVEAQSEVIATQSRWRTEAERTAAAIATSLDESETARRELDALSKSHMARADRAQKLVETLRKPRLHWGLGVTAGVAPRFDGRVDPAVTVGLSLVWGK